MFSIIADMAEEAASLFTTVFTGGEEATQCLEDQLEALRSNVRADDAGYLREAVHVIANVAEHNPPALMADLRADMDEVWYRVLLEAVRSRDSTTRAPAGRALGRMTEPLSGLRTKVQARIQRDLLDWLPPLVEMCQSDDSAMAIASTGVLTRIGVFSHRTLYQLVGIHGCAPLRCLASSQQPEAQRAAASALASLMEADRNRSVDNSPDTPRETRIFREVGLQSILRLAASDDECTASTAALAVANLEKNCPNVFSGMELVEVVTTDDCLPLLVQLARSDRALKTTSTRYTSGSGSKVSSVSSAGSTGSSAIAIDRSASATVDSVRSAEERGESTELSMRLFCARVLASAASREELREQLVDEGAAAALISIAYQYARQDTCGATAGVGGQAAVAQPVYVPSQPLSSTSEKSTPPASPRPLAEQQQNIDATGVPHGAVDTAVATVVATTRAGDGGSSSDGGSSAATHVVLSVATLLPQPRSTAQQQLCVDALADLAATPRFASVLLTTNGESGMDALLATLSAVLASRHTAELVQQASRTLANLVCVSGAEGCIADMVGAAVFASEMFPQLESLTVLPQDPVVVRNVARVLAKIGNIFAPMSIGPPSIRSQTHNASSATPHAFDRLNSYDGGESTANPAAVVGCSSAVGGSLSSLNNSLNNSFGNSWSNLSGLLPWTSSGSTSIGGRRDGGGGNDTIADSVKGHRLSSVCGSQPGDAMLPRIVRECIRHNTGAQWINRMACSEDLLVRRAAAALYGIVSLHAHKWLVRQAGNDHVDGLDELATCILTLAIAPDDQVTRLDAKKSVAKLVQHYDRFKAALVMHPMETKLKSLLQVLCKPGPSAAASSGFTAPVDNEKQLASFILRKLIESSGCRQVMMRGALADVVSDVLRIYDDSRISIHMSFVFKDVLCDHATKQKLDSEFISALLHMMSPVGAHATNTDAESSQTIQRNAVLAATTLASEQSHRVLMYEMGVVPLLTQLLTTPGATHDAAVAALKLICEQDSHHQQLSTTAQLTAGGHESATRKKSESLGLDGGIAQVDEAQLEFLGRLGAGAYGDVLHGRWRHSDVAIKCMFSDRSLDPDASASQLRAFRNEVDLMMRLRHPNIVLLMGALVQPPRLCIISELCHRGSLYQILHRKKEKSMPPWPRRLQMMQDAARGCHFLHTHDPCIVHLDLKSPNLLVDKSWNVKVADFGLAALKKHFFFPSATSPVGTPEWTAPEVLKGEPFNEKADVYSFGVVLWEVSVRKKPFSGMMPHQVMAAVGFNGQQLPRPLTIAEVKADAASHTDEAGGATSTQQRSHTPTPMGIPPKLVEIMYRCMNRELRERPGFDVVLDELELLQRELVQQSARSRKQNLATNLVP